VLDLKPLQPSDNILKLSEKHVRTITLKTWTENKAKLMYIG